MMGTKGTSFTTILTPFKKQFFLSTRIQPNVQKVAMSTLARSSLLSSKRLLLSTALSSTAMFTMIKTAQLQPSTSFSSASGSKPSTNGLKNLLHFPDKATIITYLKQHPRAKDPYLTEKKIIELVAEAFSNQERAEAGVEVVVALVLHDLSETLKLPEMTLWAIQKNLVAALKDCAQGKPIHKDHERQLP